MNTYTIVILVAFAAAAQAGELTITETDDGIVAEYTGTPVEVRAGGEKPAAVAENAGSLVRAKSLNAQMERLKKEADEAARLTGNETEEELTKKTALAEEKRRQIEVYANEIGQMEYAGQAKVAAGPDTNLDLPSNQQTKRQELKRQVSVMRELRSRTILSSSPQ